MLKSGVITPESLSNPLVRNHSKNLELFTNPLFEKLVKLGTIESVLSAFQKLRSHEEKVRFSYKFTDKYDLFPKNVVSKKDAVKAAEARNRGNQLFVNGDFLNALEQYNRTLCLSVNGSESMGMAYGNRSAVYFKTGFYEACLENIECALKNGYPEKTVHKLLKRKEDCLLEINNGNGRKIESDEPVKLSYTANPKIPALVEGIELAKNKKHGNHLIAKKSYNSGDVLMVEKPLIATLVKDKVYTYCLFCLKSNVLNLMPCDESTYAMFCSAKCYDEAKEKFFKYEGPILDVMYEFLKEKLDVIRLTLKLVTHFGNLDDLKSAFESLPVNNFDPKSFDFANSTEKDLLLAVCAFPTFENLRDKEDTRLFKHANWSASALYLIKNYTDVGQLIQTQEHETTLMKIMYRLVFVVAMFGRRLYCSEYVGSKMSHTLKGSQLPILSSFINHSCVPNAFIAGEDENVLVAIRTIKPGDQIFITYGPNFLTATRRERQQFLKASVCFDCNCAACENDFPTQKNYETYLKKYCSDKDVEMLQSFMNLPVRPTKDEQPCDRKALENASKQFTDFCNKYDKHYPDGGICSWVAVSQKEVLSRFYDNKPLQFVLLNQNYW